MQKIDRFKYLDGGSFQAIELPYKGGDVSMIVLLPAESQSLSEFEESLNQADMAKWLNGLAFPDRSVELSLPKFKATLAFDLQATLASMGTERAFSENADFSGISDKQKLKISRIRHNAYLSVNEQGSEAAAATVQGITAMSLRLPPADRIIFRADHPFFLLIRDNRTDSILFLGG